MSGSLWSLAIPAAVGVGSALLGSRANKQAADTSAAAANQAAQLQQQQFEQSRADMAPWREAGARGLAAFEGQVLPEFRETPGYQFRFGEGVRAIDQAASARGLLGSGARLRELTRYGQGVADQEYDGYMNRLASLAGLGQNATAQTAQLGAGAAANSANALLAGGQAQAAGGVNSTNALLGGINSGMGLYALMGGIK